MRDPKRIDYLLLKLKLLWLTYPDLRFGQLVENAMGDLDQFQVEDDVFLERLIEISRTAQWPTRAYKGPTGWAS